MTNYAIKRAEIVRAAEMLAPYCDGDEQLFADMLEGETDLHSIVSELHEQIARAEEMLEGIALREADLKKRKQRLQERTTATKATIGSFLRAAGVKKLELPEATYSVRDGKPTLEVVSPDAVPDEFCAFVRKPNKTDINTAFADSDNLPNWLVRHPARDVVTARTR